LEKESVAATPAGKIQGHRAGLRAPYPGQALPEKGRGMLARGIGPVAVSLIPADPVFLAHLCTSCVGHDSCIQWQKRRMTSHLPPGALGYTGFRFNLWRSAPCAI